MQEKVEESSSIHKIGTEDFLNLLLSSLPSNSIFMQHPEDFRSHCIPSFFSKNSVYLLRNDSFWKQILNRNSLGCAVCNHSVVKVKDKKNLGWHPETENKTIFPNQTSKHYKTGYPNF